MPSSPPFRPLFRRPQQALLAALLPALLAAPSVAAPYVPADDQVVLERLPVRPADPLHRHLKNLREKLAAAPGNPDAAAELAHAYYRLAQRDGDPRYIGYAQSALRPWAGPTIQPTSAATPASIRLVRALLAQFLHDFASAEADLSQVLAEQPANLAALSYRAVLRLVQARYDESRRDCQALAAAARGLVIDACLPTVMSLTGEAELAYRLLGAALVRYPTAPDNERLWVLTRLAETAHRLGRPADAERHFRAALALGIHDQYLLATYAEFLLDKGQAVVAAQLLDGETRNDVLLLRRALAEQALGRPQAAELARLIDTRIAAARLRKDELHLADEARFALDFQKAPRQAAALARRNWDSGQREPSDARMLLEAALAADDRAAAQPALDWLAHSRHEDRRLRQLAERLGALP